MSEPLLVAQHEALTDFLDDLLMENTDDLQPIPSETAVTGLSDSGNCGNVLPPFTKDGRIHVLPDWALQTFQAMVFKVGDLSLAIALTELDEVLEWQPAPSASGLYLGRYQYGTQSISVVDTARLIFAENRYDDLIKTEASQRLTRIILTNNSKWGLACDAVHEVITIQPTRVNWRSTRTRRQWLAGTLLDEMIVVLDAQSTAKILSDTHADVANL